MMSTPSPVTPTPDSAHHPAVEEYLETLYHLEESGVRLMRARLVDRLHVSAPSVSEQVKRLEREGYVSMADDRTVELTDEGRSYATAIVRRHRLAERLLVDVLGLPWHQVHEEAGRLEHAISPTLEARLVAVLDDPVTCPHGNPIPGSQRPYEPGTLRPLSELAVGESGTVARIEEELQADHLILMALENGGLLPHTTVTVLSVADDGTVTVSARDGEVVLGPDDAAAVRLAD